VGKKGGKVLRMGADTELGEYLKDQQAYADLASLKWKTRASKRRSQHRRNHSSFSGPTKGASRGPTESSQPSKTPEKKGVRSKCESVGHNSRTDQEKKFLGKRSSYEKSKRKPRESKKKAKAKIQLFRKGERQ